MQSLGSDDRRVGQVAFASHAAFYADSFAQAVVRSGTAGSLGATVVCARQGPGDWSVAAAPDLVLVRLRRDAVTMTSDKGGGRGRHHVRPGEMVLVPPHFVTTFLVDGDHQIDAFALPWGPFLARLDGFGLAGLPADGDFGRLHAGPWRDAGVKRCLDAFIEEAWCGGAGGALCADGLVIELVGRLPALALGAPRNASRPAALSTRLLRRAMDRLEADLAEDVPVALVAELVGLSPSHFARAFARATGEPHHRWRIRRRIERAKALLEETRLPVTEIALAVGFSSSQHFAEAFRRHTGTTPSRYRTLHRT